MAQRDKNNLPAVELTAVIDRIGAKGDGVAQCPSGEIYVPYTAPGDKLRLRAQADRGVMLELLGAGPDRSEPPCALYGGCGGCALQHVTDEFYRDWKRGQISDALKTAGVSPATLAATITVPTASRRRASFYVERGKGGRAKLGFYARRSRDLIAVDNCLVLHKDLNRRLPMLVELANKAPANWRRFSLAATLCENGLDVNIFHRGGLDEPSPKQMSALGAQMAEADVIRLSLDGAPLLTFEEPVIRFGRAPVVPPAGGFLQASNEGQEALVALAREGVGPARRVVDLFTGCGAFALPLSERATVDAYDSDGAAIAALKAAAAAAQRLGTGGKPVRAEVRNLFERPIEAETLNRYDAVVIDPPRAGAPAQMRALAASEAPRIVSVSCNPKTFARDAKTLIEGGYCLEQVTPVDQFVYSSHIELVGLFTRS